MNENVMPQPYMPMADFSGVHKVILDNNEIIDELILSLSGQIVDVIKNEIRQVGKPIVNDNTMAWIVGRILPYTSKIFSLSYLDDTTLRQMKYEFGESISCELMYPEELGIEKKNRDYIKDLMIHTFTATIHKAKEGETLRKLLQQHSISEQILHEDRKKKGIMNIIPNPFSRKEEVQQ